MNKELIKKHKAEFEHWLNGGKLQAKFVNDNWIEVRGDIFSFNTVNFVLVIDDEYIEYRKALAEGKTIQYYVDGFVGWQDVNSMEQQYKHPNSFRIKPEEPKFKVGDWVRVKTGTFEYDGTARISKGVKQLSKSDMWLFRENHYKCDPDKYIELWEPKEKEYFWYKNDLVKFDEIKTNCGTLLESARGCSYHAPANFEHDCEPFIGQLPKTKKDYL